MGMKKKIHTIRKNLEYQMGSWRWKMAKKVRCWKAREGPPTTLTPMTPLFTPEQLRGLHEVQSQAPHLYAQAPRQSIWQPGMGTKSPEAWATKRTTGT